MLDNASSKTPGTPEWWLLRLGARLSAEAPRFDRLDAYWRGDPPLPAGNKKMRDAYRRLQRMSRTNFSSLIAEAVLERMKVVGFRTGGDSDESTDKEAWNWWQACHLDADSGLVHRAAVVLSRAYVIVGVDPDSVSSDEDVDPKTLVTVEDPRQVIHESSPTDRRKVIAALKTYWDDVEAANIATLYLPDKIYYFRSTGVKQFVEAKDLWRYNRWEPDLNVTPDGSSPNELGEVPVTPFVNRPDMTGNGLGEFEDVTDILDRINTSILDRMVISAMQAYRQRWAKGVTLVDENGNDLNAFDPGADLLWAVEDADAQFGEFSATDLTPMVKAIESDVQYLSSISRTPPHYLLAGIVNASGDALSVAETGLTSKLLEREVEYGESWERVYRQVAKIEGRDLDVDAEVLWTDPQFRSLTEMAAASVQFKAADVPWRTRMRLLDFTPSEIDRMEAERMHDAMQMQLQNPALGQGFGQFNDMIPWDTTNTVDLNDTEGALAASANVTTPGDLNLDPNRVGKTGNMDGRGDTALGRDVAWDVLYQRAKAAGIKGASKMTKAQLQALVGG